jgi:hypothetical protein
LFVVAIVRDGPSAGGTWLAGLTVHVGGSVVTAPEARTQLNATGLLKPLLEVRSIVPIAEPPGSTAGRFRPRGMLRPNDCP